MFQTSQNLPENVHSSAREIWKRIKCFPSTPHRRKLKRNNHRSFWIWAWVKLPSGEITWSPWGHCFWEAPFSTEMFSVHTGFSAPAFRKLRFRDGLVWTVALKRRNKGLFAWRISVYGRPKHRNEVAFSAQYGRDLIYRDRNFSSE